MKSESLYLKYKVNIDDFKITNSIQTGGFGSVFKVQNINTNEILAAKVIKLHENESEYKKMISREIGIMIRCRHPTIISIRGFSLTDFNGEKNATILMDLAKKGSLADLLKKIKQGLCDEIIDNTCRQKILIGIARGMMYLHEHRIIHRDLKSMNILLDENFHPLITDFGLSKFSEKGHSMDQSKFCGTTVYMAPEIIDGKPYDYKADVYSFGIIMYEVVTDSFPYPLYEKNKLNMIQLGIKVLNEDYRPVFKDYIKPAIKKLIERCWSKDPNERPTFAEIFQKLAYNDDYSIEDMYENQDEIEENRYYLDDVDVNEIIFYADDIDQNEKIETMSMKESFKTMLNPLKIENENLKKEIQELQYDNQKLKDEIQILRKNDIETKSQITQIQRSFKLLIKIEYFNNLPIRSQHFIISELIKIPNEKNTNFFTNFNVLIDFILNYINQNNELLNYLKIIHEQSQYLNEVNDRCQIFIYNNLLDIINNFQNNRGYYYYLRNILMNFNCVIWEISYPNENFQNKYDFVSDIKQSLGERINIKLFVNDSHDSTFESNDKIDFLEFGTNINNIEDKSFNGCTSLKKIIIPSSVKSIGSKSFSNCTSLEKVLYLEIAHIENIYDSAFENCTSLKNFEIPSSVQSIGESIFKGCSSLKMITIPDSVTEISENAFNGCTSLVNLQMNNLVISIGKNAFNGCSSLIKIEIPNSVTKICEDAFNGCSSLTFLGVPYSVKSIESNAFSNCSNLKKIQINPFITQIQDDSFLNCPFLTQLIIILNEDTLIQSFDFPLKNQITNIKFPRSAKRIGQNAFTDWPSLREVDVHNTTSIQNNAFAQNVKVNKFPSCIIC